MGIEDKNADSKVPITSGWRVAGDALPNLHSGIVMHKDIHVIVGGLEPPLDVPIDQLYHYLHNPDRFLYISIRLFNRQ